MSMELIVAVEAAIPADHPAAMLAVPLGIVFFVGSVFLLLWSNYGAKKGAAITGVAWFGFAAIMGLFWWFGGPGIPAGLGVSHLPGQGNSHYASSWYAFEPGSERADFFTSVNNLNDFVDVKEYAGYGDLEREEAQQRPFFTSINGSVGQAVDRMREQFLPVDANGVAQIGVSRREVYEADATSGRPDEAARRAPTFFTARNVTDPTATDDRSTGLRLVTAQFQAYANFLDADGVPLDPVPVGEPVDWFAFFDPGQRTLPAMLWTLISLGMFLVSLLWLDRLEAKEKRLATDQIEAAEDLAVPIAQ
ncbi:MAG: hypothetical protein WD152_01585 [Nitriliruptoraceae bacterium]